jgi:hypothetical protein
VAKGAGSGSDAAEGGNGNDGRMPGGKEWGKWLSVKVSKMVGTDSMDCYDVVEVAVGDTFVDVDESVLVRLLGAFSGILSALSSAGFSGGEEGEREGRTNNADGARSLPLQAGAIGALDISLTHSNRASGQLKWTYVETLRIETLRLFITFSSSDDAHGLLERLGPMRKLPVFALVEAFKAMVSNVDRAPLVLQNVSWDRPFLPWEELVGRLTKHYYTNVLFGFYRLVGSLEVLGNPMGLVSNISQGVTNFMDHTNSGLRDLRQGQFGSMGKDFALGAASLAAGTVQGVFGSAFSLSHAMVKGMAQLTFDGDYKRARALMEQERPSHFAQGLYFGGKHLGRGLLQGVTGIFTQPVKGYSKQGARGVLKGVGKGLVGVVVKPVAGFVDMVAYTSEGIRNTPEYLSKRGIVTRVRLPRLWQPGTAVRPFDRRTALGLELFLRLCAQEEWAVHAPSRCAGMHARTLGIGGAALLRGAAAQSERLLEHAAWVDGVLGPVVVFLTSSRFILCLQLPPPVRHHSHTRPLPQLKVKVTVNLEDISQVQVWRVSALCACVCACGVWYVSDTRNTRAHIHSSCTSTETRAHARNADAYTREGDTWHYAYIGSDCRCRVRLSPSSRLRPSHQGRSR